MHEKFEGWRAIYVAYLETGMSYEEAAEEADVYCPISYWEFEDGELDLVHEVASLVSTLARIANEPNIEEALFCESIQ